jgi:serine/threonine-protein kinase
VLGEGAFGRVYLALDTELGRQVAIKVPHRDGLTPEFRERFLREARATATIHHANVCPVFDVGTDGDLPYIVMHYVVGTTLASLLDRRHTPLPERHALAIARKLALGMAAAHAKGVVHRDLKPANILYESATREVLITDFGLAILDNESRMTADGAVFGTPAYMSPEQARGRVGEVGPLSDVYALGVILYRMLTGRVPFTGSVFEVMVQHAETPPPRPSALHPGVDPRLDAICLKAMAKNPVDRFPSARALADVLGEHLRTEMRTGSDADLPFASDLAEESRPAAKPKPKALAASPAKKPRRWRRRVLAVLLVLFLAGGAAARWRSDLERLLGLQDEPVAAVPPEQPAPHPAPPPPALEVAPAPHTPAPKKDDHKGPKKKEPAAKIDPAKLLGKWERYVSPASTWVWEFAKEGTSTRLFGPGKPLVGPYSVSGDTLSVGAPAASTYRITRLTDDELDVVSATGTSYEFRRAKSKGPDTAPRIDPMKLHGKWELPGKPVVVWEFARDGKLVWSNSSSTARTYTLKGDRLPCELIVTTGTLSTTYTLTKLTDDELELKPPTGMAMTFKRAKP